MNSSHHVEKMVSDKQRKAWDDETGRKGDKRNKTKRDRSEKRRWE